MDNTQIAYRDLSTAILRLGIVWDCKLGAEVAGLTINLEAMIEKYRLIKGAKV
jgi:muramidase (phage lysozyme)